MFDRFFYYFKETLWTILVTFIGGFVLGLTLLIGIMFIYDGFFWILCFMGFISLFHLADLFTFLVELNFIALFGRLFCLYSISAFISGYVGYSIGYRMTDNTFTFYVIIFSFTVSTIFSFLYWITFQYQQYGPLANFFDNSMKWLKEKQIFWF